MTWQNECVGLMQLQPDGFGHFEPKVQSQTQFMSLNSALTCFAQNSKVKLLYHA